MSKYNNNHVDFKDALRERTEKRKAKMVIIKNMETPKLTPGQIETIKSDKEKASQGQQTINK